MQGIRYCQELVDEYRAQGYWSEKTIVDIFEENAQKYPDKEAVVDLKNRLTWLEVKRYSDRLALKFLELGIKREEVVLVQLPNVVDNFVLQVAFRKAGIVNAIALPVFRHKEIEFALEFLKAVGIVIPWNHREFNYFDMVKDLKPSLPSLKHIFISGEEVPPGTISIKEICEEPMEEKYLSHHLEKHKITAFETSVILLTSGTTGVPKIVEWPEASCIVGGMGVLEKVKATEKDTFGGVMPMSGAAGYESIFLAPPQVAAKTVLQELWDPGITLELIEKEKISILIAAPPQLEKMLQHRNFNKQKVSSLRAIRSGGGPLLPQTGVELEEKIGCKLVISSGATEVGVIASTAVDDRDDIRLFTLGKPITGMRLTVIDDEGRKLPPGEAGELLARGAAESFGYYKNHQETRKAWVTLDKDSWFRTGDIATLDKEGNLRIVGRKKDIILRGGQNIFPQEIEDAIRKNPKISDVAVVAMPDRVMGEKTCAYVTLKPNEKLTFEEMISFLNEGGLSKYALPERLEVIETLPIITFTGKVDKKALRKDIMDKLIAEGRI